MRRTDTPGSISEERVWSHLEKRHRLLDGIVITGGEPTIHRNLPTFIDRCKSFGIQVKLDTSGIYPTRVEELLSAQSIDYVAMDVKASLARYPEVTQRTVREQTIAKSIWTLQQSGIDHEFRTTVIPDWHTEEELENIASMVSPSKLYMQTVRPTEQMETDGYPRSSREPLDLEACAERLREKGYVVAVR